MLRAILFGSIGSVCETSHLQLAGFNQAFIHENGKITLVSWQALVHPVSQAWAG